MRSPKSLRTTFPPANKSPAKHELGEANGRKCLDRGQGTGGVIALSMLFALPVFAWHLFVWWPRAPNSCPVWAAENQAIIRSLFVCRCSRAENVGNFGYHGQKWWLPAPIGLLWTGRHSVALYPNFRDVRAYRLQPPMTESDSRYGPLRAIGAAAR